LSNYVVPVLFLVVSTNYSFCQKEHIDSIDLLRLLKVLIKNRNLNSSFQRSQKLSGTMFLSHSKRKEIETKEAVNVKEEHFMQATSPGREKRNRKLTSCEGQHPAFLHQLPAEKVTVKTRNSVSNKESQIRKTINCVALPSSIVLPHCGRKTKKKNII